MTAYIRKISLIIIVILFCVIFPLQVKSQLMDYSEVPMKVQVLAIIPIKPDVNSIYSDNLNYVSNQLANNLRGIEGIQTLSVTASMRKLNMPYLRTCFDRIKKDYNKSDFPDPDDLTKIANALGADKIIFVSGGFDVQKTLFHRGFKSQINRFNKIIIKPTYDYEIYIAMFEPLSGTIEWQNSYHKSFLYKNFYIAGSDMSVNPSFLKNFNKFSSKVTVDVAEGLQQYFYQVHVSKLSVQIIDKNQAREGDLTTDGHPSLHPQQAPLPVAQPPQNVIENNTTDKTIENIIQNEVKPVIQPEVPQPVTNSISEPYINEYAQPVSTKQTEHPPEKANDEPYIKEYAEPTTPANQTSQEQINNLNTPYPEEKTITQAQTKTTSDENFDLHKLKPQYEQDLLQDYQKRMIEKY